MISKLDQPKIEDVISIRSYDPVISKPQIRANGTKPVVKHQSSLWTSSPVECAQWDASMMTSRLTTPALEVKDQK